MFDYVILLTGGCMIKVGLLGTNFGKTHADFTKKSTVLNWFVFTEETMKN